MDEQLQPQVPTATPTQPTPATVEPAVPPPAPAPKASLKLIIIAVLGTAIIVSGIFLGLSRTPPTQTAVVPTPSPTPIATPTPIRQPTTFSSQSDFMAFHDAVATLSAAIAGYSAQDPSLTPPTLVLPLGFSQ